MSLSLPRPSHPSNEFFTVEDLIRVTTAPIADWPLFHEAKRGAARSFANNPAIKRIFSICMRADDSWQLVSFGPRGGVKVEWDFGRRY